MAGGGTLITFPALTALGVPATQANVTNTVALSPGYLGGTWAQRRDLDGQGRRLRMLVPVAMVCGVLGGLLLLATGDALFRDLVPYLILLAVALLFVQDPLKRWVSGRLARAGRDPHGEGWVAAPTALASVYGGYFGAGLGIMFMGVLGAALHDSLARVNALKQALSLAVNISAAVFFLFSGEVVWSAAAVMAVGALAGGVAGGRVAGRVSDRVLRRIVATAGIAIAIAFLAT
ncbi:MAG: sulfite exporter TauE/SafE family protein [Thermoleophilia bacterium]|nr:sulfite exporter TauE/SafE family protein [Thermoleophilia bacterium]